MLCKFNFFLRQEKRDAADNQTKLQVAAIGAKSELVKHIVEALAEREARQHDLSSSAAADTRTHAHEKTMRSVDLMATRAGKEHDAHIKSADAKRSGEQRLKEISANGQARASAKPANGASSSGQAQWQAGGNDQMATIMARLDSQSQALAVIVKHLMSPQEVSRNQPLTGT